MSRSLRTWFLEELKMELDSVEYTNKTPKSFTHIYATGRGKKENIEICIREMSIYGAPIHIDISLEDLPNFMVALNSAISKAQARIGTDEDEED